MKCAKTKRGKFKVSEGHKKGSPKLDMGGKDRSECLGDGFKKQVSVEFS